MITEKFRPKNLGEYLPGKKLDLEKLKEHLVNRAPILLVGPPGVGKTSLVYALAGELGYSVVEINASDERNRDAMKSLLNRVKMKSFRPIIFLLDEVDGAEQPSLLLEIVRQTRHPLVMTANSLAKVPSKVKEECMVYRVGPPKPELIVKRIKQISDETGLKPKFGVIKPDVRQSLISSFYGGQGYDAVDLAKLTRLIFQGKIRELPEKILVIWLLDNAERYYAGRDLFEFYRLMADLCWVQKSEFIPKVMKPARYAKAQYPYYLRRVELLRGEGMRCLDCGFKFGKKLAIKLIIEGETVYACPRCGSTHVSEDKWAS